MSSEDVPPEHLWEDPEGLEMWWELVKERREVKHGKATTPGSEVIPDEDFEGNELAQMFRE